MKVKELLFKELRKLADRPESEFEFSNRYIELYIDDCLKQESYRRLCEDMDKIPKVAKQIFNEMERNERLRRQQREPATVGESKKYELKGMQDDIRANELVKAISPYVIDVRQQIFDNGQPPFISTEDAIEWIECQGSIRPPATPEQTEKAMRISELLNQCTLEGTGQIGLWVGSEWKTLKYTKGDNECSVIACNPNLALLKKASENISKFTGFEEALATMHILTGTTPDYPRFEIHTKLQYSQLPTGQFVFRRYGEMKINVADITKEEITEAYNFFRERLNVRYKNPLSARQIKLIKFIEALGNEPPQYEDKRSGEIKGYWLDALNKWNRGAEEKEKYGNWFSLQRAYTEALKKAKA